MDFRSKYEEQNAGVESEESVVEVKNADEIVLIKVDKLDRFDNHIFSKLSENKFEELKESITRNGVLSPIIIRAKEDRYEIISGHNRVDCCKEIGIKQIPAIIKEYDDDKAELVMIETNLAQRENISPVEKGIAYKRQLDLLKKERKENNNLSSDTNGLERNTQIEYVNSISELSEKSEDSRATIQRLIKLADLEKELQNKVNDKVIPVNAGVELAYILKDEQIIIDKVLNDLEIGVTIEQAERLREIYGTITEQEVIDILTNEPKKSKKEIVDKFTGKIQKPLYKKYKDKFKNDIEFSKLIEYLLEKHFENTDRIEV